MTKQVTDRWKEIEGEDEREKEAVRSVKIKDGKKFKGVRRVKVRKGAHGERKEKVVRT